MDHKKLGILLMVVSLFLVVLLVLLKIDMDSKDGFLCTAVHSDTDGDMGRCPAHTSNASWLFALAFGATGAMFAAGLYMLIVGINQSRPDYRKVSLSKLNEDEKKVYDYLKNNEGSAYQSDIMKECELTKVQTTRLLDRLQAKKIVDRKRRGMTNIVILR
jgi:uncharacterized membrane protein